MPSHTDTRIFQKAFAACTTCLFLQGRVKFGVLRESRRQEAASHGSALFGFGVDPEPLAELGVIAKPVVQQLVLFRQGDPQRSPSRAGYGKIQFSFDLV
jgi:hypothetical protein